MRWNQNRLLIAQCLIGLGAMATTCFAAGFGTAVSIGGNAADIALDESRGVLYIANFTANRIEVMSLADNQVHSSMNLDYGQPGALAISPDSRFLVVTHFEPINDPNVKTGYLTVINLNDRTRQGTTISKPLGVAFSKDGRALVVTSTGFDLLDPNTMSLTYVSNLPAGSTDLPTPPNTFPPAILQTALAASTDGTQIYGVAAGTVGQYLFRYDVVRGQVAMLLPFVSAPTMLPRLSVSDDGSYCMVGYALFDRNGNLMGQFPDAIVTKNVGAHVIDQQSGTIYAHIPNTASAALTGAASTFGPTGPVQTNGAPLLSIMDADNLTVREQLLLPENLTGRAVLTAARDVIYAISDSGVTVLPIGQLSQAHRVKAGQEDLVVRAGFCDRRTVTLSLAITDPGGGNTDFAISNNVQGVTVSPSSGITPATVSIRVDPNAFQNTNGVVAVPLTISSATAVNLPKAVRLLINNTSPDQRGTPMNVPGTLTDVMADPARNRFYIVRQDKNQVLVFDGTTYSQVATLRTATTPTRMAITFDQKYLLVGHDNAQVVSVFDLDNLTQGQTPIYMPTSHYPRSIAASGKQILAVSRLGNDASLTGGVSASAGTSGFSTNVTTTTGGGGSTSSATSTTMIDTLDLNGKRGTALPTLGTFTNSVNPQTVLAASPNGNLIMGAQPDGTVFLYNASADTFTIMRKDLTGLSGAYAASSYNTFVAGNTIFNSSLVPVSTMESASGLASGFAFIDQSGVRANSPAASSPGIIERVDPASAVSKATRMVESPLTPVAGMTFTRTLAPLSNRAAIIALTTSGFTVLSWTYDAAVAPPAISAVVNSADFTKPVAPGGLITITGSQLSPINLATSEIPLPTALGNSCLTVNGVPVPMIFVSSAQINGQLPFNVSGSATMTLRTPGGTSDNFYFTINPTAPSIFRSGTAGTDTGIPTIIRASNNQLVTLSNPVHPNDMLTIYTTGLGIVSPAVDSGAAGPANPPAQAVVVPAVYLGDPNGNPVALGLSFAGLVPGEVGVYQLNVTVPFNAPQGIEVPLTIVQGGGYTTLNVRVVK